MRLLTISLLALSVFLVSGCKEEAKTTKWYKDHPEELERLKQNALFTANEWPNWEQASRGFEQAIEKSLAKEQVIQEQLKYKIKKAFIPENRDKSLILLRYHPN